MPRTKEQNEEIQTRRKEAIRRAALKIFAEKGLSAAKIGDIAAATGMSRGLMYHYYSSKEEVYTFLIRTAFERMIEAARALERGPGSGEEKIRKALNELLKSIGASETFGLSILLIGQASVSEDVPEEVREIVALLGHVPYEIMTRIFKQGQDEGSVLPGDPGELALMFWVSIKGLGMHKAGQGENYSGPSPDTILRMFLK